MRALLGLLVVLSLTGCARTAPIISTFTKSDVDLATIPEDSLRALAREIERHVADENRNPEIDTVDGITVDTPEIHQALRTRAARHARVSEFLAMGFGWERRNGRLWVLRSEAYKQATTRNERDIDAVMVNGENSDRWTLYESIVKINNLPRKSLGAVQLIFFEARLERMPPDQLYELENGEKAVTR